MRFRASVDCLAARVWQRVDAGTCGRLVGKVMFISDARIARTYLRMYLFASGFRHVLQLLSSSWLDIASNVGSREELDGSLSAGRWCFCTRDWGKFSGRGLASFCPTRHSSMTCNIVPTSRMTHDVGSSFAIVILEACLVSISNRHFGPNTKLQGLGFRDV